MSNLFNLLTALLFLTACNGQSNSSDYSNSSNNFKEKSIHQVGLIAGYWHADHYLKNIEKTKSIYSNQNYSTTIFGFELKKENLLSDSAVLFGGLEHEGGFDVPIIYDHTKNNFVTDIKRNANFSEQFELTLLNDTLTEICFINSKKKENYRKVVDLKTELRRILFEGNYVSSTHSNLFSFNRNGSIQGFGNYVLYDPIFDFGEGINYDAIIFFKTKKGGNWSVGDIYKFEFVSDTLRLYRVYTDWDNMEHRIGGLTYELIKQ